VSAFALFVSWGGEYERSGSLDGVHAATYERIRRLHQERQLDQNLVLFGEERSAVGAELEGISAGLLVLSTALAALNLVVAVTLMLDDLPRLVYPGVTSIDRERTPGAKIVGLEIVLRIGK
jgi:hypothetical protein